MCVRCKLIKQWQMISRPQVTVEPNFYVFEGSS